MTINLEAWIPYGATILAGDPKAGFAMSPAVDSLCRFEVIDLWVSTSHANSGDVTVRIGFSSTTTMPTAAALAVAGMVFEGHKLAAGVRVPGIAGIGGLDQELRITCDDPAAGAVTVNFLGRLVPTK